MKTYSIGDRISFEMDGNWEHRGRNEAVRVKKELVAAGYEFTEQKMGSQYVLTITRKAVQYVETGAGISDNTSGEPDAVSHGKQVEREPQLKFSGKRYGRGNR